MDIFQKFQLAEERVKKVVSLTGMKKWEKKVKILSASITSTKLPCKPSRLSFKTQVFQ